ncbi:CBS and ACT domain-containing protein [Thermatribacter velox]|uniref:CBS and ACT domain-containing protein n=1 Tax=Thermatribacter velox TaxID=3039681 RepID=A0ABZ2Y8I4_9BACT
MLVRDRMTREVITINSHTPILEAQKIMKDKKIRRLPVVDNQKLVGIVTYNDLLEATPSKVTTLSRFELTYLLSKMTVAEIMKKMVITVSPDTPLEEVALIMKQNEIGGVPVVEDSKVVGIITESDIFEALVETLGVEEGGSRITLELPQKPGILHEVTGIVKKHDVNILSLATFYDEEHPQFRYVVMRVAVRDPGPLVEELSQHPEIVVKHVWVSPEEEV